MDACLVGYGDAGGSHTRLMKNVLGEGVASNKAPGAPKNLKVTPGANGIAMFSWDAPEDDQTSANALKYNLYIKQGDVIRMTVPADIATGRLKVSEVSGLISKRVLYKVTGLTSDYTWGVQAVDNAKVGGPFAMFDSGTGIDKEPAVAPVKIISEENAIRIVGKCDLKGVVNVYSMDGGNVYSESVLLNDMVIELSKGIYLVKIMLTDEMITKKVIVW